MNYLHVFLARGPVEKDKVAGGIERVCLAWYDALLEDAAKNRPEENHFLYSFTHEEKESIKLHDNHILSTIPCGKKGRRNKIGAEMQEITNKQRIDVIINHTFSDGIKMNASCEMVLPYAHDKKLTLINVVHLHAQLALVEAPFITQKDYFRDLQTYAPKNPDRVNTVFVTTSESAANTYTGGCETPDIPAIPMTFADFGTGFFSFVNDVGQKPVLKSNGDLIMIGRADSMKRLPETLKHIQDYKGGNIHVFTKANDGVNGIINRLNKMAKDQEHIFIHNDHPRDEMFEIIRHARAFVSGSYKENAPTTMVEVAEYGIPSILGFVNNFNKGYPATTIFKNVDHFAYNIDDLKDDPNSILDIVDTVPSTLEYRINLQDDTMENLGVSTFPNKWYAFINDITKPENHNQYCNRTLVTEKTESLF